MRRTVTRSVPTFSIADLESLSDLDLGEFTNEDAVNLGLFAVTLVRAWDFNLAIEIVLRGDVVFRAKLKTTGIDNDPWLAGKAAVVRQFGEPSLLVKLRHEQAGTPFDLRDDIDHTVMKAYGGAVPLLVDGALVGTLTMSGEPDAIDHYVAAETLKRYIARRMDAIAYN